MVRVELYKKTATGGYDSTSTTLKDDEIMSVNITRRIFETSSADVLIDNTKRDKILRDIVRKTDGIGEYDNYTKVKIYINDNIAFIGVIKQYHYDEDNNTYSFRAEDFTYKLMKTIDCTPIITYKDTTAFTVIKDLYKRAGIDDVKISSELKDYPIKQWKVEYNSVYMDVLDKIFSTLYARSVCKRDGSFEIVRCYPPYDGTPTITEKYESIDLITTGEYDRNEADIRNKLVVKSNEKDAQAFICPYLLEHCNNEVFIDSVDEELADTLEKKYNLALKYFRNKLRHSKKFSIGLANGSVKREIGDIVRTVLNQSNVKGWGMINGITTTIQDGLCTDKLEIELLVADKWILPKTVEGNYNLPREDGNRRKSNKDETFVIAPANTIEKFEIDRTGRIKLGFVDIEKQPYLEIQAFFNSLLETKHYDLVIQDPNKAFYGYKQQILKDVESPITKTNLNSCESIAYSGWSAQLEYFKINKPMPGRWYIYLQSDTNEDYEANISVNMEWKKVQIDG